MTARPRGRCAENVYFIFINLPFAGLTDLLSRTSDESGHLRTASAQPLRFEWWPILMHSGFEVQAESIALFDRARTHGHFSVSRFPITNTLSLIRGNHIQFGELGSIVKTGRRDKL